MAGKSLPVLYSFKESFKNTQYFLVLHNIYFWIPAAAEAFLFVLLELLRWFHLTGEYVQRRNTKYVEQKYI